MVCLPSARLLESVPEPSFASLMPSVSVFAPDSSLLEPLASDEAPDCALAAPEASLLTAVVYESIPLSRAE